MQTTLWFIIFGFICFQTGRLYMAHRVKYHLDESSRMYDKAIAQSLRTIEMTNRLARKQGALKNWDEN